jgi:RNA polymerase sigma-70 factor (ECF subfamily)
MTVYVFDKDTPGSGASACTGGCLQAWPPVLADSATPTVDGSETGERELRALYDAHALALLGYAMHLWRRRPRAGGGPRPGDAGPRLAAPGPARPSAGPVRPWLFTVAEHLAIDAHRARRARPREVGEAALDSVPDLGRIESTLDRIVVTDALQSLSHEHRAVIVETYYRGRTVAEAADVLGVPPGTVKSRCYYALRALKLALAERGLTT